MKRSDLRRLEDIWNLDPKSLFFLSLVPIVLYSLSVLLIIHVSKTKNDEQGKIKKDE